MKKKDLINLKNKSSKELRLKAKELKKSITGSALESKLGKSKNVHETRNKRIEMAQILTFMNLSTMEAKKDSKKEGKEKIEENTAKLKKVGKNDTK